MAVAAGLTDALPERIGQYHIKRVIASGGMGPLAGLINLQVLYLHRTLVTNVVPLATLTILGNLNLEETRVSDVAPLAALTNLRYLYLRGAQVSSEQVAALKRTLPNLRIEI